MVDQPDDEPRPIEFQADDNDDLPTWAQEEELQSSFEILQSKPWWKWVLPATVVFAIGIAIAVALVVGDESAPVATANEFVGHLDDGDYDAAVALTDPACSNAVTAATLSGVFAGRDIVADLSRSEIIGSGATVTGTVEIAGVGLSGVVVTLRNVDGDWKICGISRS